MLSEKTGTKVVVVEGLKRAVITTYDSGYEHTIERLIETKAMVAAADEEPSPVTIAAKAS